MNNSKDFDNYIRLIKLNKRKLFCYKALILILIIMTWELFSKFNIIDSFIFSAPSLIFKTVIKLIISNNLIKHLIITIMETLIAFITTSIIAFCISSLMWRYKLFSKIIDPYLTVLNSLPKIALGPLIIIWVGASKFSIIFMAFLISIFITTINFYIGFISLNNNYILLARSFFTDEYNLFLKIILPGSIKQIFNTLKINISMTMIGLLPPVGENLNSNIYCSKYLSHYF